MKILLAEIRHLDTQAGVMGGDKAINDQIFSILNDSGHKIVRKSYPSFDFWKFIRRYTLGQFNTFDKEFDLVICDSNIAYYFNHPNAINIFHYSYFGYKKLAGKYFFNLLDNIIFSLYSVLQYLGSKGKYNVAVSMFMKKVLLEQGIKVNEVVNNCLDTDVFKPIFVIKSDIDLVYVGGYSYFGKGFDVLEDIASRGYHIDCYTNFNKEYKNMKYHKMVPRIEIPKTLCKYKILLYPSRFESFGMVPLEAMACGIPVIVGNIGIGCDIINDIPEFVVNSKEDNRVSSYIEKINLIQNNYKYYSDVAREYAKKNYRLDKYELTWNNLVERI